MPPPHPRPRLLTTFCQLHSALVATYPARFRHEFEGELLTTYRDVAADMLREPGIASALALIRYTFSDWLRTLANERSDAPPTLVLGIAGRAGRIYGCAGEPTDSVGLLLASLGLVLMIGGWGQWLRHEAELFSQYAYQDIALNRSGSERGRVLMKRTATMRPLN